MNIIHLPPVLPGELDVPAINQKLHTGEATLDWSSVEEAPQEAIAELLAGLDLVEHNELLGIVSVPDQLSESILQVLTASTMPLHPAQHQSSDTGDGVPDIWEPASEEQNTQEHVLAVNEKAQKYVTTRLSPEQTPRTILQAPSTTALRDELERLVLQDLLGPAGGAESDPLCAEHVSLQDHSLHRAACHAYLFLPEISCERGNKYLDRSVLVPTVDITQVAFFASLDQMRQWIADPKPRKVRWTETSE